jgi:alkylation response protein AidB-like acyl-CoA dehydrogenase
MSFLLGLSDDLRVFGDTLRRLVEDRSQIDRRDQPRDRLALWSSLAELGALGIGIPADAGGYGGSPREVAVPLESLAHGLLVEPLLAHAVMSARMILPLQDRRDALIDDLISGKTIFVLAHQEDFDPFAVPLMRPTRVEGGYLLSGRKPCIRQGDVATNLLITAASDEGKVEVFLVPTITPDLSLTSFRLVDGARAADLVCHDIRVPDDNLLKYEIDPLEAIHDALEWGLVGLCAETVGLIRAANKSTFDYLNVREQFGVKLSSFQALQHRAADMAIAEMEASAMASSAVEALSAPPSRERSRAILAASLACDAAGRHVAHEAVQLHGGMGVSDELAISHIARRCAAIRGQIGTTTAREARLSELSRTN